MDDGRRGVGLRRAALDVEAGGAGAPCSRIRRLRTIHGPEPASFRSFRRTGPRGRVGAERRSPRLLEGFTGF